MFRVLIAEDDIHTQKLMETVLHTNGYLPLVAGDGQAALDVLEREHVDLLLVDVMMPKMDGYELTRQLRAAGMTLPILMVTAKQLPEDMKKGFLLGVDDYMVKPVDEEEMLLRIKALLWRSKIASEHKLQIGEVTLDYDALTVSRQGEQYILPQKEFYLLYMLLSYAGKVFTRLQIMDEIWGMESETTDATVNVHINRLRNRFADWKEFEIVTVRGLGYKAVKRC